MTEGLTSEGPDKEWDEGDQEADKPESVFSNPKSKIGGMPQLPGISPDFGGNIKPFQEAEKKQGQK